MALRKTWSDGGFMAATVGGWSLEYELGLGEIDSQHASLLAWVARAYQDIEAEAGSKEAKYSLEEFEQYVTAHFVAEEAYMQELRFSGLDAHRQMHQRFLARIVAEKYAQIAGNPMTVDLLCFLHDWLVDHILVADKAYAEHVLHHKDETILKRFFRHFG